MGGLASIIWAALGYFMGDYEQFKYKNSVIGSIYQTSPLDNDGSSEDLKFDDKRQAKHAMMRTVAERGKYFYNYSEYLCSGFLRTFCSCCCSSKNWYKQRIRKLERHDAATKRLDNEIDIIKFIYVLRLG